MEVLTMAGKSVFSTPYFDDQDKLKKFSKNADKVFKRNLKKPNSVNEQP
tara:strand:- start:43 stop:189 length:147 start_codon:yes stop_codon:yes gene_type:complete